MQYFVCVVPLNMPQKILSKICLQTICVKRTFMLKSIPLISIFDIRAGLSELADEADSKSVDGNIVRVQVPPPASKKECRM